LILASVTACREPEPGSATESRTALLDDRRLEALDLATPHTRFDGTGGSMLPESGWAPVEEMPSAEGRTETFSWVVGKEASVWVEHTSDLPMDLVGDCRPVDSLDGEPQTLTLHVGGLAIGPRRLEPGWQEVRIPIPGGALRTGFEELRLRFGLTRRPADLASGSDDRRRLAAACRYLALAPRAVDDVEGFLGAVDLSPPSRSAGWITEAGSRTLRLALGTGASFPLPAGKSVRLRLGRVRSSCRLCRIRAEVQAGDGQRSIVQARVLEASGLSASFTTRGDAAGQLRLRFLAAEGEALDLDRTAEIELPPDFLAISGPDEDAERPDVFLILVDTLRADALEPYGARRKTSPRVAAFADDAVLYENAWSASSWTLPSVVSILTGSYPFRHGVMRGTTRFSDASVPSLARWLGDTGYHTLGISQSHVASDRFGIDTGFERFFLDNQLHSPRLLSQDVRRVLLFQLLRLGGSRRPMFVYIHTVAPHAPYTPPAKHRRFAEKAPGSLPAEMYDPGTFMAEDLGGDPREVAHLRALYDGEVAYADGELGRLLAMLRYFDLYDDSLIVLLSDHGEEFGEHGGFSHGRTVYEELLRVPLIVKYPRSRWAGRVVSRRVSTVDLVPTILQTAGIDFAPAAFDGMSIRPPEVDRRPRRRRPIFAEVRPAPSRRLGAVDYQALAVGDLKCIESATETDQLGRPVPRWQTFDLGRDPREQQPLGETHPAARRCRTLMEQWTAGRRTTADDGELPSVDEEALDELRALGYIE
jgi:arylsulfatase A-like enzyme